MIVSFGLRLNANAGSFTFPKVDFPCLGGTVIASFKISPASNFSRYPMMSACAGLASNAGIMIRLNWLSDRRASANRTSFGVTVVMFMDPRLPRKSNKMKSIPSQNAHH